MIRVGPAGWTYPDSPGRVWPADAPTKFDGLAFLAGYFDTIEINASFYAPPAPRTCRAWVKRVAHNADFRFTAKLWQKFTHGIAAYGRHGGAMPREHPGWEAGDVAAVTEGLSVLRDAGRFGALLAQFPWSFRPTAANRGLLERLAADFDGWPVVVEVRHGAWGTRAQARFLRDLGLGFCNVDQPLIGSSLAPTAGATSAVGYVRLHGRRYDTWFEHGEDVAARYDYLYTADELAPWVERIRKVSRARRVEDVYVVTNNHFEGKGPANALMIRSLLTGATVRAPPDLYRTYRDALSPFAEPA